MYVGRASWVNVSRGEESHNGVPGGTILYVGALGIGYIDEPNKIVEGKTYDICPSVLLEVSTPERNTTAENREDWMKPCKLEMNSSLQLWGQGCQEMVSFIECRNTLSTGALC